VGLKIHQITKVREMEEGRRERCEGGREEEQERRTTNTRESSIDIFSLSSKLLGCGLKEQGTVWKSINSMCNLFDN
jgi:hypothetical protein